MPSSDRDRSSDRRLGLERCIFFSDAVFAIAITLLVLDLKFPHGGGDHFDLRPLIPNLIGFGLSFYVIGRYWLVHHALLATIRDYDRLLLRANLLFLASIAFLPFPTSVVALAKADTGSVVFYVLSVAIVGLLMMLLALAARRPSLLRPGETRGGTANILAGMAASPVVFIAAAGMAFYSPRNALLLLLLLLPVGWLAGRFGRALQRKIDSAAPENRLQTSRLE